MKRLLFSAVFFSALVLCLGTAIAEEKEASAVIKPSDGWTLHIDVLPDLSPEEAAKTLKGMEETYGKVYILWNPAKSESPVGKPAISILH